MDFRDIHDLENATTKSRKEMFRFGTAMLFIVLIILFTSNMQIGTGTVSTELVIAAMIGGYMALNIGANDVANNVGPAVGSKALTLTGAIIIAAIFESAGALIAGGDVVSTIKKGIIDPALIGDADTFIWLMMSALLAGAVWLNLATALGAPVSTTHSIVGGVLGAGIAAAGWNIANWDQMSAIAASWVISPVIGGLIAAAFLMWIKKSITYKEDMLEAAKRVVPILIAIMAWAFSTYLILKGLKKVWKTDFITALLIGLAIASVVYLMVKPMIARQARFLDSSKASINQLFTMPLIFAAALLSFAHGANDVANAVGPLAAINDALQSHEVSTKAEIPLWVMVIGALGISLGLMLFGPKLIRTVGSEITELDQMRAFSIAMAAAITVIVASQLGLPVSSTHIAVGAIFGVGFLREYLKRSYAKAIQEIKDHHQGEDEQEVNEFINRFSKASVPEKKVMLAQLKEKKAEVELSKKERKSLNKVYQKELVKRSAFLKIVAAWVITVPASALLAAFLFFAIRGMMLP
ncbi:MULTISPECIES: inorganic phosphate transporter [Thiomicrorhabdus]|uniref:Phosphate transporter n=1 Tax=Thiomicrorhabdus xiamenensis TaxID=2739063 RepID=A0A7D4SIJ9_9GAMM|nr:MULTISPECIES: inorganic phosphate transporter [Thiomicrorhabdus]MBO1922915.1 inorganic phosphate transporter [Thiomicrorhabdus sp. 6S3-12]QKI89700.1 inorganic phosphate transporter [Thiomicrorhabdus xiamenensis]